MRDLGRSIAFHGHPGWAKSKLDGEFLVQALGHFWEVLKQREGPGQECNGLAWGRALDRILRCLVQIVHRSAGVVAALEVHGQLCR
jgi:hypothetical protein